MAEWRAFYELDPWGDQRADLRMAKIISAILAPHMKNPPAPVDLMPFPDDEHDINDDLPPEERAMQLKLKRIAG